MLGWIGVVASWLLTNLFGPLSLLDVTLLMLFFVAISQIRVCIYEIQMETHSDLITILNLRTCLRLQASFPDNRMCFYLFMCFCLRVAIGV